MSKYALVAALVLVLNSVAVWFLATPVFEVLGWWSIILFLVEGGLVGRLTAYAIWDWHLRDQYKALEKEWENTGEQTWRVVE
jgi:hypothetical protein